VDLARGGGEQHGVKLVQPAAGVEHLAEGSQAERDDLADLGGKCGRAHRRQRGRLERPALGPANALQAALLSPPLNFLHLGLATGLDRPGRDPGVLHDERVGDRLPDRRLGKDGVDTLGREP
jgi:hypothetical protein